MRRKLLALSVILSLSLVLVACGKKTASDSTSTDTSVVSETSVSSTETSESDIETFEVSKEDKEEEKETEAVDNKELYDGFLNGTEKAVVTAESDHCEYYSFKNAMTAGEAYTLDEIITNLRSFMRDNGWEKEPTLGEVNSQYIDCGNDGKKELYVSVELPVENIEDFVVHMIIVEKSGKLVVAFGADSWSRCDLFVDENGEITSSGADGAAAIVFETSFVNAEGDYVFGYKGKTAALVSPTDFYLGYTTDVSKVDLSGFDTDGLMIEVISFKEEPTVADTYVMLYNGMAGEDVADPSAYAESDPLRQAFESVGLKVVTLEELDSITVQKMQEKGYK